MYVRRGMGDTAAPLITQSTVAPSAVASSIFQQIYELPCFSTASNSSCNPLFIWAGVIGVLFFAFGGKH
jgi:hypothetical protein